MQPRQCLNTTKPTPSCQRQGGVALKVPGLITDTGRSSGAEVKCGKSAMSVGLSGIRLGDAEPLHDLQVCLGALEAPLLPVGMAGNELQTRPPTLVLQGPRYDKARQQSFHCPPHARKPKAAAWTSSGTPWSISKLAQIKYLSGLLFLRSVTQPQLLGRDKARSYSEARQVQDAQANEMHQRVPRGLN